MAQEKTSIYEAARSLEARPRAGRVYESDVLKGLGSTENKYRRVRVSDWSARRRNCYNLGSRGHFETRSRGSPCRFSSFHARGNYCTLTLNIVLEQEGELKHSRLFSHLVHSSLVPRPLSRLYFYKVRRGNLERRVTWNHRPVGTNLVTAERAFLETLSLVVSEGNLVPFLTCAARTSGVSAESSTLIFKCDKHEI